MPVENAVKVVDVVDRDPFAADLAERPLVVGVEPHQRRHVEVDGDAGLAVLDEVAEAGVRVLRLRRILRSDASSTAAPGTSSDTGRAGTGTRPGTRL